MILKHELSEGFLVSLKGLIVESSFRGSQRIIVLVGFGLEIYEAHNSLIIQCKKITSGECILKLPSNTVITTSST
jgi:hypothetical protein